MEAADMTETEHENDRELRLLKQLDDMTDSLAWESIVKYMAPQLCQQNPKLMFEIVARRALKLIDERKRTYDGKIDQAEMIAQQFGTVGLKLTIGN
jgi:hypothetical protein